MRRSPSVAAAALSLAAVVALGVARPAYAQVWASYGPEGASASELAIHPSTPANALLVAGNGIYRTNDSGVSWLRVYQQPGNGFSGVVRIAQDPSSAAIAYATNSSGVLKTADGGDTWSLMNTGLTSTNIGAIAIAPSSPSTLLAATASFPDTIYRSTNGGASWSVANTTLGDVRDLAIDPTSPAVVYAATSFSGVHKSSDGGFTWSPINTGLPGGGFYDVAVDPLTPTTLWAAPFFSPVHKSTNGGASWSAPDPAVSGFTIEIDPSAPGRVYVAGATVHRTTNGGASWTSSSSGLAGANINDVAVVPGSATDVFACTGRGLFASADGGGTWSAADAGIVNSFVWTVAAAPAAPNVVYAGTNWRAAVVRSADGGLTWVEREAGLPTDQVRALAVAPRFADSVLAALGSFGVYKTGDGGTSWSAANAGLPGGSSASAVAFDRQSPFIAYVSLASPHGVYRTANGGTSWSAANAGLPPGDAIGPVVVDPDDGDVLYVSTSSNVYKSTDAGTSWALAATGLPLPALAQPSALALDPADPDTLYLDRDDSLYKSTDGALTWSLAAATPGGASQIVDVAVDPTAPGVVYLSVSLPGGVLRSDDGGATFSPLADLGSAFVTALSLAPTGRAYAATWTNGVAVLETTDCPAAPLPACKIAPTRKSSLGLTVAPVPQRDLATWTWTKGPVTPKAEFGDPLATNGYVFCVYDRVAGAPTLALEAHAPAGGICGTRPCWKESATGFKYTNRSGSADGFTQLSLKEGLVPGRASITAKAQGAAIGMPGLPLAKDPTVTAQLVSATGCWTAVYGTASTNTPARFRAKAD